MGLVKLAHTGTRGERPSQSYGRVAQAFVGAKLCEPERT